MSRIHSAPRMFMHPAGLLSTQHSLMFEHNMAGNLAQPSYTQSITAQAAHFSSNVQLDSARCGFKMYQCLIYFLKTFVIFLNSLRNQQEIVSLVKTNNYQSSVRRLQTSILYCLVLPSISRPVWLQMIKMCKNLDIKGAYSDTDKN